MGIVRFILSGFWRWTGAAGLIVLTTAAIVTVIKAVRPVRKIEAGKVGSRWHIRIEGANARDIFIVMSMTKENDRQAAEERK